MAKKTNAELFEEAARSIGATDSDETEIWDIWDAEGNFTLSEADIEAEIQRILRFPGGPDCAKGAFDAAYGQIGKYGGRPYGSISLQYKELLPQYDIFSGDDAAFFEHWIINIEKKEPDEANIERVRKALERALERRASGQ